MPDYTVLIVEDNEKNRKLMRDLMRVHGYQYLEAEDGLAGVEAAREHHPDLILMDIQLPGLDGYSATQQLKADESTRAIPIVVVTSFAMQGEEGRARQAGCDAYLSKPIDIHQLIATVQRLLPQDESGS
jgi:two-component system, cell cycle response regulator DivK